MSVYLVGKLCYDASRDPAVVEAFKADPDGMMERYGLTEEEKERMRSHDIIYFYELGLNPYLVGRIGQFMGMGRPAYWQALAGAKPHPMFTTVSFPGPAKNGKYIIRNEDIG